MRRPMSPRWPFRLDAAGPGCEIGFSVEERWPRRSVGASIQGHARGAARGVAANLAGGTHHASADKAGSGYRFQRRSRGARLMQASGPKLAAAGAPTEASP